LVWFVVAIGAFAIPMASEAMYPTLSTAWTGAKVMAKTVEGLMMAESSLEDGNRRWPTSSSLPNGLAPSQSTSSRYPDPASREGIFASSPGLTSRLASPSFQSNFSTDLRQLAIDNADALATGDTRGIPRYLKAQIKQRLTSEELAQLRAWFQAEQPTAKQILRMANQR